MTSTQLALEPVGLDKLGEALRDGAWVDLRIVEVGTLERVQVQTINVHRTKDEVVVVQKWPFGDEVRSSTLTFDAEDVRWCRPSEVPLESVQPLLRPRQVCGDPEALATQLVGTAAFIYRVSVASIFTKSSPDPGLRARQAVMWALYEMSDMDPPAIAARFGYRSQMPIITVSDKVLGYGHRGENVDHEFRRSVERLVELVEDRDGHRYRRQEDRPWKTTL